MDYPITVVAFGLKPRPIPRPIFPGENPNEDTFRVKTTARLCCDLAVAPFGFSGYCTDEGAGGGSAARWLAESGCVDGPKLRKRGREARSYLPDGPLIDGVQWHGLLPIDLSFNPAIPNQFCHYTDNELFSFVRSIKMVGGAITIDVPIDIENGHIPEDSHSQLVRLSEAVFPK